MSVTNPSSLLKQDLSSDSPLVAPYNEKQEWRTSFASVLAATADPVYWTQICKGAGQTVSQSGGNLLITAGATATEELIIRSKGSFKSPNFRALMASQLSQRNANNSFNFELVDVVGDNLACLSVDATHLKVYYPPSWAFTAADIGKSINVGAFTGIAVATGGRYAINAVGTDFTGNFVNLTTVGFTGGNTAGTCSMYGYNFHRVEFTAAVATQCNYSTGRKGWADAATVATINTSAAPGTAVIIDQHDSEATMLDRLVASLSVPTARASRFTNVPDPDAQYYLQLRATNAAVAPTATTWTVAMAAVQEFVSNPVSVETVRPQSTSVSLPVSMVGGTLPALTTLTGGSVAEDAATATNPLTVGGVVRTATAPTTLVAGDAARMTMTSGAALVTQPFAVPDVEWSFTTAIGGLATAADTAVKAAGAAGIRNYVTGMQIQNNSATAGELQIKDGATVIWRLWLPANQPPLDIEFGAPLRGTAATVLNAQAVTVGMVAIANIQGFQAQ